MINQNKSRHNPSADFYKTKRGRLVTHLIYRQIKAFWQDINKGKIIGAGNAIPWISKIYRKNKEATALCFDSKNIIPCPPGISNQKIVKENKWQIDDNSIDKILLIHGLESADTPDALLREAWRVLKPMGKILVITPNRRGLWAHYETTPFGHGMPYSKTQLKHILENHSLTVTKTKYALFIPPLKWRFGHKAAIILDKIGEVILPFWAGVILMEAEKKIYAAIPESEKQATEVHAPQEAFENQYKNIQTQPSTNNKKIESKSNYVTKF